LLRIVVRGDAAVPAGEIQRVMNSSVRLASPTRITSIK
jgi:hypothetical protein